MVEQRQRLLAELSASGLEQNAALAQEASELRLAFVHRQRRRRWSHADVDAAQLEAAQERAAELQLDLLCGLVVDREPIDIEDRVLGGERARRQPRQRGKQRLDRLGKARRGAAAHGELVRDALAEEHRPGRGRKLVAGGFAWWED